MARMKMASNAGRLDVFLLDLPQHQTILAHTNIALAHRLREEQNRAPGEPCTSSRKIFFRPSRTMLDSRESDRRTPPLSEANTRSTEKGPFANTSQQSFQWLHQPVRRNAGALIVRQVHLQRRRSSTGIAREEPTFRCALSRHLVDQFLILSPSLSQVSKEPADISA